MAADEDVAELVRQHPFTEGASAKEDRALAVLAAVLADQPGHSANTSTLGLLARKRDPSLPSLKGKLGRLLDACPVFVHEPSGHSAWLNVDELKRAADERGPQRKSI